MKKVINESIDSDDDIEIHDVDTDVEEAVADEDSGVMDETNTANNVTEKSVSTRAVLTREKVTQDFEAILADFAAEIERVHETPGKPTNLRWLRSMRKRIETIHKHNLRVCKQKRKNPNRKVNTNSGFLKPRLPSKELAEFLGLNPDEEVKRTSVHSAICKYVRDNGLKSKTTPGKIVPDASLQSLFNTTEEFRHCDIQSFLCAHFPTKE